MTLWWGLIIIPLIGIVWGKIFSQSGVKTTAFLSEADLLPNCEEFESDSVQMWVQNEEISLKESVANASTFPEVSSCKSDAKSEELICEYSSSDADALPEDHADDASSQPDSDLQSVPTIDDSSSNKSGFSDYENVSKTLQSLIKSISEPAKLVQKAELYDDTVLPNRRCFINLEHCNNDLVWNIARRFGMRKSCNDWDVMWIDVGAGTKSKGIFTDKCLKMKEHQLISHFPGFWSLSSKDLLVRNWQRMQKYFPTDYSAFPRSWILPRDALQLSVYARNHKSVFFIAKPADSCAGRGIFVTRDVTLEARRQMIYQLYVRPFLIDGYKFDFRVYVLVTSCNPLRIYVHNEGLARFATVKYEEPTKENCGNVFMHLTNSCVNTRNPSFVKDEFCGHSRRLSAIFKWFRDNHIDSEKIQQSMDDAVIKTIIAVLPTVRHNYNIYFPLDVCADKCFEIMGFDIMLDYNLNIYVLEVNPSPSFGSITHTKYEAEIKESVVRDTFRILQGNIINKLRNKSLSARKRGKRRKQEIDESIEALTEWEKSHLGNFRLVYPPVPSLGKYYQKFIDKGVSMLYNLTK